MPRVNFKTYQDSNPAGPSDLQIIVAEYGPYLTLKEVAQCLHRTYGTIYGLVRAGELTASRMSRKGTYIIPASAIITYIDKWRYPSPKGNEP